MKKAFKWIGIAAASLVVLGIIGYLALIIYDPGLAWVKPGISQTKIPAGVDTAVVFENVNLIPMDSNHMLEGQSVVIDAGRILEIGQSGEVNIPADAHTIDGSGNVYTTGRFSGTVNFAQDWGGFDPKT